MVDLSVVWSGGTNSMAKYALYVSLKAKPGKEKDVEAFLKQGAEMAKKESGTVSWFGLKEDECNYSVFDTFNDEAGRDAHLNGEIAKALMAKASEMFASQPQIHKINILADK
jgi:quinol monooxygenase YgiN